VATSQEFTPDAHPESTSCDGQVGRGAGSESFGSIRGGAGANEGDSIVGMVCDLQASSTTNEYTQMSGCIILFDITGLPTGAVVTGVDLELTPTSGPTSDFDQLLSCVQLTTKTGGDTGVNAADYTDSNRSTTELLDSPPANSSFAVGVTKVMAFNATGVALVETINQGAGIVRLCFGHRGWTRGFSPTWSSLSQDELILATAESVTVSDRPGLVIQYVIGEIVDESFTLVESIVNELGLFAIVNEAVNLVESLTSTPVIYSIVDEAVNVVESVIDSPSINAVVDEALNFVETVVFPLNLIISKIIISAVRGTRFIQSYIAE
jgi:hypothetical protein